MEIKGTEAQRVISGHFKITPLNGDVLKTATQCRTDSYIQNLAHKRLSVYLETESSERKEKGTEQRQES